MLVVVRRGGFGRGGSVGAGSQPAPTDGACAVHPTIHGRRWMRDITRSRQEWSQTRRTAFPLHPPEWIRFSGEVTRGAGFGVR